MPETNDSYISARKSLDKLVEHGAATYGTNPTEFCQAALCIGIRKGLDALPIDERREYETKLKTSGYGSYMPDRPDTVKVQRWAGVVGP